jgi:chromosome segregation and condensation protein ScpB
MNLESEIEEKQPRSISEIVSVVEALIFVADEPITVKILAEVLDEDRETVEAAVEELKKEYEARESGLLCAKSQAAGKSRRGRNFTKKSANF